MLQAALARDRMGEKPLYWTVADDVLVFLDSADLILQVLTYDSMAITLDAKGAKAPGKVILTGPLPTAAAQGCVLADDLHDVGRRPYRSDVLVVDAHRRRGYRREPPPPRWSTTSSRAPRSSASSTPFAIRTCW